MELQHAYSAQVEAINPNLGNSSAYLVNLELPPTLQGHTNVMIVSVEGFHLNQEVLVSNTRIMSRFRSC